MSPEEKAEDLVNSYRMVLMNEDTDCGCEILCTSIAIKNALICVDEILKSLTYHNKQKGISDEQTSYFWNRVKEYLESC